jgi:hypothetical protein
VGAAREEPDMWAILPQIYGIVGPERLRNVASPAGRQHPGWR